jgi:DNA polymerase-3 subunit alpha
MNRLSVSWKQIKSLLRSLVDKPVYSEVYSQRLEFEIEEVEKQGAESYWLSLFKSDKKFSSNPNNLLMPFLLGMVSIDPISSRADVILCSTKANDVKRYIAEHGKAPGDIQRDSDMPDIDLDCLPSARDPLKEYAAEKYGNSTGDGIGSVCSVGTWQTYKFKSALTDVAAALRGRSRYEMEAYTKEFPQDADELREGGLSPCKSMVINDTGEEKECKFVHDKAKCPSCGGEDTEYPTLGKLLIEIPKLAELYLNDAELVKCATMLVGRVRNMGMHAGALIITDRPLFGNIPLSKSGSKGYWTSLWTEGRSTQLSKFGYVKWDVLGLKTLEYIFNCCKMIEQNRGITFGDNFAGIDDIDPDNKQAGVYYDKGGNKCAINLDDPAALALANLQKTDAIFQFDTDLAKSILKNGVKNFFDLMLLNALGHPGPMQSIPDVIANRDDRKQSWKSKMHPEMLSILGDTYGHLVYQEQLQAAWQNIAGFTAPEAQEARKAVAKKWTEKLKPIKEKWVEGASKKLGLEEAELWWTKMATFGRYAFNRCLSKDTLLYDPVLQVSKTVEQWRLFGKPFKLFAYDGQNTFIDTCVCIHDNGVNEIFEVKFDDGSIERLTAGHKLLCEDGQYHEVSKIFERGLDVKKVESYRPVDDAEDMRQGQSVVW